MAAHATPSADATAPDAATAFLRDLRTRLVEAVLTGRLDAEQARAFFAVSTRLKPAAGGSAG